MRTRTNSTSSGSIGTSGASKLARATRNALLCACSSDSCSSKSVWTGTEPPSRRRTFASRRSNEVSCATMSTRSRSKPASCGTWSPSCPTTSGLWSRARGMCRSNHRLFETRLALFETTSIRIDTTFDLFATNPANASTTSMRRATTRYRFTPITVRNHSLPKESTPGVSVWSTFVTRA